MDKSVINDLISKCWTETTHLSIKLTAFDKLTDSPELFIASVVFYGKSQGTITLATGPILAKKIAGMMFDYELDTIPFDDIQDSMGELVNILAGNMKTDFFGDSDLSKPLVMQGSDELLKMLASDLIFQKTYVSDNDQQFLIQICQTD